MVSASKIITLCCSWHIATSTNRTGCPVLFQCARIILESSSEPGGLSLKNCTNHSHVSFWVNIIQFSDLQKLTLFLCKAQVTFCSCHKQKLSFRVLESSPLPLHWGVDFWSLYSEAIGLCHFFFFIVFARCECRGSDHSISKPARLDFKWWNVSRLLVTFGGTIATQSSCGFLYCFRNPMMISASRCEDSDEQKSRCQKSARTLHNTLLQVMISHHLSRCRVGQSCRSSAPVFLVFLVCSL